MRHAPRYRSCDPGVALPGWRLLFVVRADCEPGLVIHRENHQHTSFSYIESGYGVARIAGKEARLGPGDAFILPRGKEHELIYDREEPWRQLFVGFAGDLPDHICKGYGLEHTHLFREAPIVQPLRNLIAFDGDDRELQLYSGAVLQELVIILHRHIHRTPDWPTAVLRAKAFIDANLERIVRLADVANHVGCSEAHLSRNFRRCVGTPPGDYLIRRRMDLAKALLSTGDTPVKAIADRLCYRDTFAFSHAFKAVVGHSPSAWRTEHGGFSDAG